jgi:Prolyl oligopeptidase family
MGWTGRPIGSNEHFMGGDKDFNLPLAGGEQLYQALKSVDTPAELVVCPGEFHTFTRRSFIKDRYQRWFEWYDKYVRGKDSKLAADLASVRFKDGATGLLDLWTRRE